MKYFHNNKQISETEMRKLIEANITDAHIRQEALRKQKGLGRYLSVSISEPAGKEQK